jgi:hypothetical protein
VDVRKGYTVGRALSRLWTLCDASCFLLACTSEENVDVGEQNIFRLSLTHPLELTYAPVSSLSVRLENLHVPGIGHE